MRQKKIALNFLNPFSVVSKVKKLAEKGYFTTAEAMYAFLEQNYPKVIDILKKATFHEHYEKTMEELLQLTFAIDQVAEKELPYDLQKFLIISLLAKFMVKKGFTVNVYTQKIENQKVFFQKKMAPVFLELENTDEIKKSIEGNIHRALVCSGYLNKDGTPNLSKSIYPDLLEIADRVNPKIKKLILQNSKKIIDLLTRQRDYYLFHPIESYGQFEFQSCLITNTCGLDQPEIFQFVEKIKKLEQQFSHDHKMLDLSDQRAITEMFTEFGIQEVSFKNKFPSKYVKPGKETPGTDDAISYLAKNPTQFVVFSESLKIDSSRQTDYWETGNFIFPTQTKGKSKPPKSMLIKIAGDNYSQQNIFIELRAREISTKTEYAFRNPTFVLTFIFNINKTFRSIFKNQIKTSQIENDPLTGLPNRRGIFARFISNIGPNLQRKQIGVTGIAIADIDHFKRINEIFGHDVGDKVLIHIASILDFDFRLSDMIGRYGGEEFLIFANSSCNHQDKRPSCEDRIGILKKLNNSREKIAKNPYILNIPLSNDLEKPSELSLANIIFDLVEYAVDQNNLDLNDLDTLKLEELLINAGISINANSNTKKKIDEIIEKICRNIMEEWIKLKNLEDNNNRQKHFLSSISSSIKYKLSEYFSHYSDLVETSVTLTVSIGLDYLDYKRFRTGIKGVLKQKNWEDKAEMVLKDQKNIIGADFMHKMKQAKKAMLLELLQKINNADNYLKTAKRNGRNMVVDDIEMY